jgi:putative CocE/NonD family hydrolase
VWRDEQEWPLARAKYTPFYLHSAGNANSNRGDGKLSAEGLGTDGHADQYDYDPRYPTPSRGGAMLGPRAGIEIQNSVETRSDVLVYSTMPLDQDVEVTGPVSAVLYVSTSAPNTDFTVKLVDVHPDGKAYNVSDGILRRSYDRSTTPHEITVQLWPTSMLFQKGHQIRVEVSSSNYPRYDRNPNTGDATGTEKTPRKATQIVFQGARAPSRIILPLISR